MPRKKQFRPCSIVDCPNQRRKYGFCVKHYKRFQRFGTTDLPNRRFKCKVDGCSTVTTAKHGMCQKHYYLWKEHGDPTVQGRFVGEPDKAFWTRVDKNGPIHPVHGQCWVWTGGTTWGYGQIRINGEGFKTHRYSWFLHFGEHPTGQMVCHKCDNPPCVRPDHLFLGDNSDNRADSVAKKRHAFGERMGTAKLTEFDVYRIRSGYYNGMTSKDIAEIFGVRPVTIRDVLQGLTWKHVLFPEE